MEIKYIVVHSSATKASMDIGRFEINKWHKEKGWNGIGYHFVIRRNGEIQTGRQMSTTGAHVYGYNKVSWGICMVGGVDKKGKPEDNYTKEQYDALEDLLNTLHRIAPKAEIVGHRDLSPDTNGDGIIDKWEWLKACPCFDVSNFVKDRGIIWTKKRFLF